MDAFRLTKYDRLVPNTLGVVLLCPTINAQGSRNNRRHFALQIF